MKILARRNQSPFKITSISENEHTFREGSCLSYYFEKKTGGLTFDLWLPLANLEPSLEKLLRWEL